MDKPPSTFVFFSITGEVFQTSVQLRSNRMQAECVQSIWSAHLSLNFPHRRTQTSKTDNETTPQERIPAHAGRIRNQLGISHPDNSLASTAVSGQVGIRHIPLPAVHNVYSID